MDMPKGRTSRQPLIDDPGNWVKFEKAYSSLDVELDALAAVDITSPCTDGYETELGNKPGGSVKVLQRNLLPLLVGITALVLIITGIILIANSPAVNEDIPYIYTDCTPTKKPGQDKVVPCKDKENNSKDCDCFYTFELKEPKNGTVAVFYELKTFDATSDDYKHSKDDRQLRGDLSGPPSPNCGNYSNTMVGDVVMPIAPCGAIADSMFTDTFILIDKTRSQNVPRTQIGLIGITDEDRKLFHNPPNMSEAFKNYTKPISWDKHITEKNAWQVNKEPNQQGLENEAFIAWMKTDLKTKPAWRVNHTGVYEYGLPVGNYSFRIGYKYPFRRYSGERKAIMRRHISDANVGLLTAGIVLIVLALSSIGGLIAYNKVKHGKYCYYQPVKDV